MIHQKDKLGYDVYVFPLKFAPLKFSRVQPARKVKGLSSRNTKAQKLKEKEKCHE